MSNRLKNIKLIKGDTAIVIIAMFLVLVSFAVAFSTSSNLVNIYNTHSYGYYFVKHLILVGMATGLFIAGMKMPVQFLRTFSKVLMIGVIGLLLYTLLFGVAANGDSARRWIRVLFFTIQPSFIAMYVIMIFTSVFLDKIKGKKTAFVDDVKHYWAWVGLAVLLIMPANNSTAFMITALVFTVLFVGGYGIKKLSAVVVIGLMSVGVYYLAAKAFPSVVPNRFETLENRIKRFFNNEEEKIVELTQPVRARMAIATGGFFRFAPGKSVQKNMLSQSSSDFVYAIIVEEYGMFGGMIILVLYFVLFLRVFIIAQNLNEYFLKILTLALGLPVIAQALINMSVAVGLIPVTGQPLPLISTGGTTILMTGLVLGILVKISEKIYEET